MLGAPGVETRRRAVRMRVAVRTARTGRRTAPTAVCARTPRRTRLPPARWQRKQVAWTWRRSAVQCTVQREETGWRSNEKWREGGNRIAATAPHTVTAIHAHGHTVEHSSHKSRWWICNDEASGGEDSPGTSLSHRCHWQMQPADSISSGLLTHSLTQPAAHSTRPASVDNLRIARDTLTAEH